MSTTTAEAILRAEVARLTAQMADAETRATWASDELRDFKKRVAEAAAKGKKAHGWCSEIDDIVNDLGLEMPSYRKQITVDISLKLSALLTEPDDHTMEWYRGSVTVEQMDHESGRGVGWMVFLDDDFDEVEADDYTIQPNATVEDVTGA